MVEARHFVHLQLRSDGGGLALCACCYLEVMVEAWHFVHELRSDGGGPALCA